MAYNLLNVCMVVFQYVGNVKKMKRIFCLSFIFLFACSTLSACGTFAETKEALKKNASLPADSENDEAEEKREIRTIHDIRQNTMADKLGRGLANIVLSPWEIPKQIMRETEQSNAFYGATSGVFVGFGRTALRIAVGAVETATFLLPFPTSYDPIMRPAYVFQEDESEKESELVED